MVKIKSKMAKKLLSVLLIISFIIPLIGPVGVYAQVDNKILILYSYRSGIGNEGNLDSINIIVNTRIEAIDEEKDSYPVGVIIDGRTHQQIGSIPARKNVSEIFTHSKSSAKYEDNCNHNRGYNNKYNSCS